jgi:tetratricopeptide (TPR) repeat protein
MIIALRIIYGARLIESAGAVSVSWLSAPVEMIFVASRMLWLLASPCIFYLIYSSLRSGAGDIDSAFRSRQGFRRSLEAATINPRDAEAHYQLGLIYQYRRQHTEAINRFKKAIEIDQSETDAHFQLGRIARQQSRLQEAIEHFNTVVSQDDNHAHSEIWREIGATYADAAMFDEARSALDTYLERRPYDPEGLYLMAQTLNRLEQREQAREMLERCLESVRTMPFYRRGAVRKWGRLAQKQLREIEAQSV